MNFETKYIIRWGIPGWLFLFWICLQVIILKETNFAELAFTEIKTGLTFFISLVVVGVPLGYLMHQLYFSVIWVITKKSKMNQDILDALQDKIEEPSNWGVNNNQDYYYLEAKWHLTLLKVDDSKRIYLEERYRHFLGRIHSMGSLFASSLLSFLICTTILIAFLAEGSFDFLSKLTMFYLISLIMQFIIGFLSAKNYIYFSQNLKSFQIHIMKEYL